MGRLKTSKRLRTSSKGFGPKKPKIIRLKKDPSISRHDPSIALTDETLTAQAFWQCLKDNEPEEAIDVIATYLEQINRVKRPQEKQILGSTLFRGRKNLTIKTLAKILHDLS